MRRSLLPTLALLLVLAGLTLATPAAAATGCIGAPADEPAAGQYNEQRQFVETQSWWTQDGGTAEHIHLGLCLPDRETLNATATPNFAANVRLIMHNNPGTVTYASMVFKTTDAETTVQKVQVNGLSCPVGTCQQWLSFSWPLSAFNHTGLQEIRFRVFVPEPQGPDGTSREMRGNLNFQTYVTGTGKSLSNVSREPWLRGKGWYTSPYLYCEATYVSVPLPDQPVAGTWTPTLKQQTHTSDGSLPVTNHFVTVDPDFHAIPPVQGQVLVDGAGPWGPTPVPVDTLTLPNGTHKLYQRADCHNTALSGGTNAGVLVVPFVVQN